MLSPEGARAELAQVSLDLAAEGVGPLEATAIARDKIRDINERVVLAALKTLESAAHAAFKAPPKMRD